MSLKLLFNSPKGHRPKPGQIYLMHTSVGYIPAGVTSNDASWCGGVMLHLYRALAQDPEDTSYYPLVARNELLLPPVMIAKRDFKKGGGFTRNADKNAPTPVPFEKYYSYAHAFTWDPEERAFVPVIPPLPDDRLGDFIPKDERRIQFTEHDSDRGAYVEAAPDGAYFLADMFLIDVHLEFALEDSLAYYGLINTPRPPHPDMVGAEEAEQAAALEAAALNTKDTTMQPTIHITDFEGTTTVFAAMDQLPDNAATVIADAGFEPSGYFFDGLVSFIITRDGLDAESIEFDSEAGMFSIIGNADSLTPIHATLTELVEHPDTLATTITDATAAGTDFEND